jgi:hypothetical protein
VLQKIGGHGAGNAIMRRLEHELLALLEVVHVQVGPPASSHGVTFRSATFFQTTTTTMSWACKSRSTRWRFARTASFSPPRAGRDGPHLEHRRRTTCCTSSASAGRNLIARRVAPIPGRLALASNMRELADAGGFILLQPRFSITSASAGWRHYLRRRIDNRAALKVRRMVSATASTWPRV